MTYFNSRSKYVNKAIASALIAGSLTVSGALVATSQASAAGSAHMSVSLPADPALKKVLDSLVTKGTISAAQESAILDAMKAAAPAGHPNILAPQGPGPKGFGLMTRDGIKHDPARVSIITNTLNETLPQIQTQLLAGKSLSDIATATNPTLVQTLITALVAYDTKKINAQVSANKISPAAAAKLIATLTAKITAEVNSKGYRMPAPMGNHMPMTPNGNPQGAPNSTPSQ